MIKNSLLFIAFLALSFCINAQTYRTAGGIRFGTEIGLTFQQKILKKTTIEGILQTTVKTQESLVTVLLEKHNSLISKRFNFYLGAGIHKGWIPEAEIRVENPFCITAIAGVEFTIARINLSWDYKPAINVFSGDKLFNSQTAISVRYVLIKKKKKEINLKFWEKDGKKKQDKKKKSGNKLKFWEKN